LRSIAARDGGLNHPGVSALWRTAADEGITVNLQIGRELAAQAEGLLQQFRGLPVALDHSLRLEAGPEVAQTLEALRRLARHPNCHTKMSFVANGPRGCLDGYPCADFHHVCLEVIDIFGPERSAWGSHFPLEKFSPRLTYTESLRIYADALGLRDEAKAAVLGGTAKRLWFPNL
jgi:predicted TIM-barrel fold metal-dependent hydrolase